MTNEEIILALEHLIGTPYEPTLKIRISELTGRRRVVGPRDRSTREFDPTRIHIVADVDGVITGFSFN